MTKYLYSLLFLLLCSFAGQAQMKTSATSPAPYGKTIFSFAPMQMTNESPAGIGIQFEHFLDDKGRFSLYLPFAISFYKDEFLNSSAPKNRIYSYVYPGMKIYPTGSHHKVSYSVGPSLALGFGERYTYRSDYDHPNGYVVEDNQFKAGFMVNNGLNLQPTPAFYIGLEFGVGFLYYKTANDAYVSYQEPLVQFQFKMGYRF